MVLLFVSGGPANVDEVISSTQTPLIHIFKIATKNNAAAVLNIVGLIYVSVTTVLFFFPPEVPTTGSSMNYAIVAFVFWLTICVVYWFTTGRKTYEGPLLDGVLHSQPQSLADIAIAAADHTEFNIDDKIKMDGKDTPI
ncbi:uncharacterized protein MJAP1_000872 [Malassezia japonica]|uniref:Uncharacterized protein n=1 Tax=Malassezia japonica TaxID=223818 RepID=A0AAF0F0S5_9BASI|nr:uncharacterized protein MJAP1_000872 [Malassezia japonica]WFD37924.1 hypothetical protein MJAP1_000872 [Malassezia japonica]